MLRVNSVVNLVEIVANVIFMVVIGVGRAHGWNGMFLLLPTFHT